MIDDRINTALRELERELRNIDSARNQVVKTVNSFNGLSNTTKEYIDQLAAIMRKLKDLSELVEHDFDNKSTALVGVMENINDAVSKITTGFSENVKAVQKKLHYTLIMNVVIAVVAIASLVICIIK